MKQKKYDDVIIVKIEKDVKKQVDNILDNKNMSISEYVRENLYNLVQENKS